VPEKNKLPDNLTEDEENIKIFYSIFIVITE
jgi:hypothetical protein